MTTKPRTRSLLKVCRPEKRKPLAIRKARNRALLGKHPDPQMSTRHLSLVAAWQPLEHRLADNLTVEQLHTVDPRAAGSGLANVAEQVSLEQALLVLGEDALLVQLRAAPLAVGELDRQDRGRHVPSPGQAAR